MVIYDYDRKIETLEVMIVTLSQTQTQTQPKGEGPALSVNANSLNELPYSMIMLFLYHITNSSSMRLLLLFLLQLIVRAVGIFASRIDVCRLRVLDPRQDRKVKHRSAEAVVGNEGVRIAGDSVGRRSDQQRLSSDLDSIFLDRLDTETFVDEIECRNRQAVDNY